MTLVADFRETVWILLFQIAEWLANQHDLSQDSNTTR